jgi:hypothetical protein
MNSAPRVFRAASLLLLAGPALAGEPARHVTDALERPFAAGGRVRMELSAGDYEILAGDDDAIQVEWRVADVDQLRKVRVRADVDGSNAVIRSEGPSNHFSVTIHVPARSDLEVALTAGDLRVKGIEGNKEIRSRAGDIDVDLVHPEDYKRVAASLWAGDLRAEPLGISKGGLFRSFEWEGKGRYKLSVRLLAGDIRLYASNPR